ncbi:MAG: methylenetetrahydrofolate--tRNA-(uracil(54)-C(5))-methyltransferase (FADH(2)-oxidizing) TrmFO [Oscillospiraceae bacterium]
MEKVSVIGAGLAGCEAAMQLSKMGISVDLYEMKPTKYSPAHKMESFAELVCSNSLKAMRLHSAAGLLKSEMNRFNSIVLEAGVATAVPAGGALAVERVSFSNYITKKVSEQDNINIIKDEVVKIPDGYVIIATGPLTSNDFACEIQSFLKTDSLSFFDAAAPIVSGESIDMSIAFAQSRYDRGDDDYINCPMNKIEYEKFYEQLISAESAPLKEIDKRDFRVYEGCMPVEVMAKRGADTIRFGPLKPVGLRDPRTGHRPWANVQLRKENKEGTLYNIVGFQTNLKFGEQKRVFSLIPGLENADFIRYGVMHRNTFIDSPRLLDNHFCLKQDNRIYFAGQITGVEGYTESAASGILAGYHLARKIKNLPQINLPSETMMGALCNYISDETVVNFQPMGSNMGILPKIEPHIRDKAIRYEALAQRSVDFFDSISENL